MWEFTLKHQDRTYDRFYDYEGEIVYHHIKNGGKLSDEDKQRWNCKDESEFLKTWRSNSDEAFEKWLVEHGY